MSTSQPKKRATFAADGAYMQAIGLPRLVESLLSDVLEARPETRDGVLRTIIAAAVRELKGPTATPSPSAANAAAAAAAATKTPPNTARGSGGCAFDDGASPLESSGGFSERFATSARCPPPLSGGEALRSAKRVTRVVLTGGPCAGKTTGIATVRDRLEKEGFIVLSAPEASTLLFNAGAGVAFHHATDEVVYRFQLGLLKLQVQLERELTSIALACGKPAVVLCDRGAMDGQAFCTEEMWARILRQCGWTTESLRDEGYDMVVHLVTAADGAEACYTTENNTARTETPEQARQQDRLLRELWGGHAHHVVIRNESTDFDAKMDAAADAILSRVGVARTGRVRLRYELRNPPGHFPAENDLSFYQRHVLRATWETVSGVSAATCDRGVAYLRYTLRRDCLGQWQRTEQVVDERTYCSLLSAAERPAAQVDIASRRFVHDGRRCEVIENANGSVLLFVQADEGEGEGDVSLPAWIAERGGVVCLGPEKARAGPVWGDGSEAATAKPKDRSVVSVDVADPRRESSLLDSPKLRRQRFPSLLPTGSSDDVLVMSPYRRGSLAAFPRGLDFCM